MKIAFQKFQAASPGPNNYLSLVSSTIWVSRSCLKEFWVQHTVWSRATLKRASRQKNRVVCLVLIPFRESFSLNFSNFHSSPLAPLHFCIQWPSEFLKTPNCQKLKGNLATHVFWRIQYFLDSSISQSLEVTHKDQNFLQSLMSITKRDFQTIQLKFKGGVLLWNEYASMIWHSRSAIPNQFSRLISMLEITRPSVIQKKKEA